MDPSERRKPHFRSVDGVMLPPVKQVDGFHLSSPASQPQVQAPPAATAAHAIPGSSTVDRKLTADQQVLVEPTPQALISEQAAVRGDSLELSDINLNDSTKRPAGARSIWRRVLLWAVVIVVLLAAAGVAAYGWYQAQLKPVVSEEQGAKTSIIIDVKPGSTPTNIGALLEEKGVIRSARAFVVYTQLSGTKASLKAGSYNMAPTDSVSQIVSYLTRGSVDEYNLTFYPGATLTDTTATPEAKKVDVTTQLKRAGFEEAEIASALAKRYSHPVLADKPSSADLEGYIFGETYRFSSSATVEDIIKRALDELQKHVEQYKLVEAFKKQDLTLYQGITLASIVQREVLKDDQAQVAQVFYSRLRQGMNLGSDVTYHYAADKQGVTRSYLLDSPYNTRKNRGLPPGPIAAPGLSALRATATPALGDYLYFVSGDDDKTYFARTNEEHENNVRDHCHDKCLLP